MTSDEQYFECNTPSVIYERFEDETILINLDAGHYYSIDPLGAAIWQLLNRPLPLDRVVEIVSARYASSGASVGEAVRDFVARMRDEGLIRVRRQPPPESVSDVPSLELGATFSPPVLAKYDDMQEMLLLDPVHDVAEAGWPAAAGPADDRQPKIEDDDASAWPSLDDES